MESKTSSSQGRSGYSADERQELMEEFRSSGLTQADFCRQWEINPTTFSGWLRADRQQPEPVEFCEVQMSAAITGQAIVVELPGGVQVKVPGELGGSFSQTLREVAACWG